MTKYRILCEKSVFELQVVVNDAIARGWEPIGGVSVEAPSIWDIKYLQAVILNKENYE